MKMTWTRACTSCVGALLALTFHRPCEAALLDLSGRVKMLDGSSAQGVDVRLGVDLDRNGEFHNFEELHATVAADGSFRLEYTPEITLNSATFLIELMDDVATRGFAAVLDDGPLPIVVTFQREGYTTMTRRITTASELLEFDVMMDRLLQASCSGGSCFSPDGGVQISGLPAELGVARVFARAHDPRIDGYFFPGDFADDDGNLLISGGFTEIELRDSSGKEITKVDDPVAVRFEADPTSWASLRDLQPDSERIEVPMYSFDEDTGQWVSEEDGELQGEDGTPIPESDFPSILDGTYSGQVFIAFSTLHFSTFNCDAPIQRRACIQGRMVLDGEPVGGEMFALNGVNYSGTAGVFTTFADGSFASDVMKSELDDEDVDFNGQQGETFRVRVSSWGKLQVTSASFANPTTQGTVGQFERCSGRDCDCEDLGDVELVSLDTKACKVQVRVTASGASEGGAVSPLAEGSVLSNLRVTARDILLGSPFFELEGIDCSEVDCGGSVTDADGVATLYVPATSVGEIEIEASGNVVIEEGMGGASSQSSGSGRHFFSGEVVVDGCGDRSELDAVVELALGHTYYQNWSNGVANGSGSGSPSGSNGGADNQAPGGADNQAPGCACTWGPAGPRPLALLLLSLLALPSWRRARRPRTHLPGRRRCS